VAFNKDGHGFNSNDKKSSYKHFFIKETSQNEFQGVALKIVTLVVMTNVALFIIKTTTTWVRSIRVLMTLIKDTTNTVLLTVKMLCTQESYRYGCPKDQCP